MPALNFVIPAGWGTCTLCFEGSPASAHLWGRAGSLRPLLSSCDSSRRHLSPLAWCERVAEPAQPVGGGSGCLAPPLSPASKSSWRGKALPRHLWDVPSPETQGPVAQEALQGALGLLRPQKGLNLPSPNIPPFLLLEVWGMPPVPAGGELPSPSTL